MPVTAIVGAQWGDEGKGKITDLMAQDSDLVIRFGGGSNAGHTVVNEHGEFTLHIIPSGIFNSQAISLIGTGTVVDFDALTAESTQIFSKGLDVEGLRISNRSHVVMPYHLLLDRLEDKARGKAAIGTTGRGIGPTYVDKAGRVGIQAGDLLYPNLLKDKLEHVLSIKNEVLQNRFNHPPLQLDDLLEGALGWAERYRPVIIDQVPLVLDALAENKRILLEGQLGALRDLDWGTYPFVTSSTTIAGGGAVGGGIPARYISDTLGVVKAYTTAVGAGPFPTQLDGAEGEALRERGNEYGATTGRARSVGWFDGVAARYSCAINGFTGIAVTKLDILDGMPQLKLAVAYRSGDDRYALVPHSPALETVVPEYEEMPGWQESTAHARSWHDLPGNARAYLQRIETLVGAPIRYVSVGRAREQTICL